MTIVLAPPTAADADELLAFETENRSFFEAHVNARPAAYYSPAGVAEAIELAVIDARGDVAYQYLVRDAGHLVGRINLTRVRRHHFHSAELGYRIGKDRVGVGYASEAVRQVIALAFEDMGLLRLEAIARPENLGSIRVLEKNHFVPFGRSTRSFELHGVWYDRIHFERHASSSDADLRAAQSPLSLPSR